jgi:hypothetical protein
LTKNTNKQLTRFAETDFTAMSDFLCKCDSLVFALFTQLLIYKAFSQNQLLSARMSYTKNLTPSVTKQTPKLTARF